MQSLPVAQIAEGEVGAIGWRLPVNSFRGKGPQGPISLVLARFFTEFLRP